MNSIFPCYLYRNRQIFLIFHTIPRNFCMRFLFPFARLMHHLLITFKIWILPSKSENYRWFWTFQSLHPNLSKLLWYEELWLIFTNKSDKCCFQMLTFPTINLIMIISLNLFLGDLGFWRINECNYLGANLQAHQLWRVCHAILDLRNFKLQGEFWRFCCIEKMSI